MRIDDVLQLDIPPDMHAQSLRDTFDTSCLRYLLITHTHYDHCAVGDLEWLAPDFSYRENAGPLIIAGNRDVIFRIPSQALADPTRAQALEVMPGDRFTLGDYSVLALEACHPVDQNPLNFVIEKDGLRVLFAVDTGHYTKSTWNQLAGQRVDLVVVDCTFGPERQTRGNAHLGLPDVLEFREKAERLDIAVDSSTTWVITHFSHLGGALHDELESLAAPHGLVVGYDGLELML